MDSCLHVCVHLQPTYFFRLGFWGRPWLYQWPCIPYSSTFHEPRWGGLLPSGTLPPFCLYTEITCQALSSLNSHVSCLSGVFTITQHFISCVLLLKGKFPKGGSFPVPLTCYRWCQEACLAEVELSKILLGERDVKLGQESIGNGSETGTLLGLGFAYLPLLMMQLASQLVICIHYAHLPLLIMEVASSDPHLQWMEQVSPPPTTIQPKEFPFRCIPNASNVSRMKKGKIDPA